ELGRARRVARDVVAAELHVDGRRQAEVEDLRDDVGRLEEELDARSRLQQYGLTASNVGQNVLIALSGSSQTAPAYWLNPQNGVVYSIA
ncbi:hypothetical protein FGX01_04155, partial [Xylella fastidiosa subsp. multiplex]|nr:hypothetical protein [Xylella fastidiosa subsp. multiplex]